MEDGRISIPQEVIDKLRIDRGSKLRVTVEVEKGITDAEIPGGISDEYER